MRKILTLLYHRVNHQDTDLYNLTVNVNQFEKQMKFLKKSYNLVKFDDDWNEVVDDSVSITFDDGYYDNYKFAFPILLKYGIPATFFITTGYINGKKEFWWDNLERLCRFDNKEKSFNLFDDIYSYTWPTNDDTERINMTLDLRLLLRKEPSLLKRNKWMHQLEQWSGLDENSNRKINICVGEDEIKKMDFSELITIGAHTVSHRSLGNLDYNEQEEEIIDSIKKLETIVGHKIEVFSYPFGKRHDYTNETVNILKRNGIKKSATTEIINLNYSNRLFEIPRVSVCGDMNIEDFSNKINYSLEKGYGIYRNN